MDLNSYISGFVDGEGCFCVSFQPRKRHRFGWEVRPSFSVSQNARKSRTSSYDSREVEVGMRIYPAGQIRQDTQVRNTERQRVGSESAATLQSVSVDVVEAS